MPKIFLTLTPQVVFMQHLMPPYQWSKHGLVKYPYSLRNGGDAIIDILRPNLHRFECLPRRSPLAFIRPKLMCYFISLRLNKLEIVFKIKK